MRAIDAHLNDDLGLDLLDVVELTILLEERFAYPQQFTALLSPARTAARRRASRSRVSVGSVLIPRGL
jgi:hypothetical protein